jgi:hypothetical protein
MSAKNLVSQEELSSFWTKDILKITVFKVGRGSFCSKEAYLVEETHVSLQRQPFVLEVEACSTWFPCENCVRFWKEFFL